MPLCRVCLLPNFPLQTAGNKRAAVPEPVLQCRRNSSLEVSPMQQSRETRGIATRGGRFSKEGPDFQRSSGASQTEAGLPDCTGAEATGPGEREEHLAAWAVLTQHFGGGSLLSGIWALESTKLPPSSDPAAVGSGTPGGQFIVCFYHCKFCVCSEPLLQEHIEGKSRKFWDAHFPSVQ